MIDRGQRDRLRGCIHQPLPKVDFRYAPTTPQWVRVLLNDGSPVVNFSPPPQSLGYLRSFDSNHHTPTLPKKSAWLMSGGSSTQMNANQSSTPVKQAPTAKRSYTATKDVYAPIVVDGHVFFTAEDKHLYAVDAATGQELWRTSFAAGLGGTPAYSNGALSIPKSTTRQIHSSQRWPSTV